MGVVASVLFVIDQPFEVIFTGNGGKRRPNIFGQAKTGFWVSANGGLSRARLKHNLLKNAD
jgi:hypothetical protein